jgi:hypothetical protein
MADRGAIERAFQQTLAAVKTSNAKFAFDREGRPGAIAAIRGALPMMERDLFEDYDMAPLPASIRLHSNNVEGK